MKTNEQLLYRVCIILFVFLAMPSCRKDKDTPPLEYEAKMGPGVVVLQWENGLARATVSPGDIVAVFSTASDTEQTFTYTIQLNGSKSNQINSCNGKAFFNFPLNLRTNRPRPLQGHTAPHFNHLNNKTAELGDTEIFWTWDLSDISSYPNIPSVQVTAILKAKGTYCDVYVDENSSVISVEDAIEIARQFDEVAFPIVTTHFGEPPVVDGSSRVAILLPLAFNGGVEEDFNPNGWAAGAFNDLDQYPPSAENPHSNFRNVLYINPVLYYTSNPVFVEKWRSILSHEFQHMVNFRYHGMNEAVPIDEGKALLAEILSGYGLPYGDFLMWANVAAYQDDPAGISLLQMAMSEENPWGSYGMGLLWVCYLYDRFGTKAIYDMATHPLPGLEGAAAVTGIPKQHLFAEWLQANILNGKVNDKVFEYKTIAISGDGGGQFYGTLNGFAALPEHAIPGTERERLVHSFGLEYWRADADGEVVIKGSNIKAFIMR